MRIKQLYCAFGTKSQTGFIGFKEAAIQKYGFEISEPHLFNHKEPLFVAGCYNHIQASVIINHSRNALVVVYWCGSDSSIFRNDSSGFWADMFKNFPNIKHIAPSHWIAEDLKAMGLDYIELPALLVKNDDIKPEPLGECVYVYQPNKLNYGSELYQSIKQRIPFKIIETTSHSYTREQLIEVYKQCFIGLRFTEHDGLSETVCEMGLMGRQVIHNGDTPNCIKFNKNLTDEIVWDITSTYQNRDFINESDYYKLVAKQVEDYLNVGEDFLNTEFYEVL